MSVQISNERVERIDVDKEKMLEREARVTVEPGKETCSTVWIEDLFGGKNAANDETSSSTCLHQRLTARKRIKVLTVAHDEQKWTFRILIQFCAEFQAIINSNERHRLISRRGSI